MAQKRRRRSNIIPFRKPKPARTRSALDPSPGRVRKAATSGPKWRKRLRPLRIFTPFIASAAALFALLAALDYAASMRADSPTCRVLFVVDGDTVQVACPGEEVRSARLLGFDTPELYSPKCLSETFLAIQATWKVRRLIWFADTVVVRRTGVDRYDRILARLILDGVDVSRPMIASGLARPYDGGTRAPWC